MALLPSLKSSPPPSWDRQCKWLGAVLLTVFIGSRLLLLTQPESLRIRTPEEWQQTAAASDVCGSPEVQEAVARQKLSSEWPRRYLPVKREFHGLLLVNNGLLVPIYCGLWHSERATQLLALLYWTLCFTC
jgi:hypothetical protein